MSVPRQLVGAAARSRMAVSGGGSRTVISWVADDEVDGGLVDALRAEGGEPDDGGGGDGLHKPLEAGVVRGVIVVGAMGRTG